MTEEMKQNSATGWCVLRLDPTQNSTSFITFCESEGDARSFAEREAEANDGVTFMVFQKFGSAQLQHRVEWKGRQA